MSDEGPGRASNGAWDGNAYVMDPYLGLARAQGAWTRALLPALRCGPLKQEILPCQQAPMRGKPEKKHDTYRATLMALCCHGRPAEQRGRQPVRFVPTVGVHA